MPDRSFARKDNRDRRDEDGEKARMIDNENTNKDDIEDREADERMARPKRDFSRKKEKMDRRSAKDVVEDEDGERSRGGGRRSSNEEDEGNDDEPAGAKDEPVEEGEDNGDIEMAGGKKKGKKWFKGKSKFFGKGKKGDRSDNEVDND